MTDIDLQKLISENINYDEHEKLAYIEGTRLTITDVLIQINSVYVDANESFDDWNLTDEQVLASIVYHWQENCGDNYHINDAIVYNAMNNEMDWSEVEMNTVTEQKRVTKDVLDYSEDKVIEERMDDFDEDDEDVMDPDEFFDKLEKVDTEEYELIEEDDLKFDDEELEKAANKDTLNMWEDFNEDEEEDESTSLVDKMESITDKIKWFQDKFLL